MNKSIGEQLDEAYGEIVKADDVIPLYILKNDDRDALIESLKNPPEPNEALKTAFKYYMSNHDVFDDIGRDTFEKIAKEEELMQIIPHTAEIFIKKDKDA